MLLLKMKVQEEQISGTMTSVIRIKQQFIRVGSTNSPTLEWAMAVVDKIQTDFLFVQSMLALTTWENTPHTKL